MPMHTRSIMYTDISMSLKTSIQCSKDHMCGICPYIAIIFAPFQYLYICKMKKKMTMSKKNGPLLSRPSSTIKCYHCVHHMLPQIPVVSCLHYTIVLLLYFLILSHLNNIQCSSISDCLFDLLIAMTSV